MLTILEATALLRLASNPACAARKRSLFAFWTLVSNAAVAATVTSVRGTLTELRAVWALDPTDPDTQATDDLTTLSHDIEHSVARKLIRRFGRCQEHPGYPR